MLSPRRKQCIRCCQMPDSPIKAGLHQLESPLRFSYVHEFAPYFKLAADYLSWKRGRFQSKPACSAGAVLVGLLALLAQDAAAQTPYVPVNPLLPPGQIAPPPTPAPNALLPSSALQNGSTIHLPPIDAPLLALPTPKSAPLVNPAGVTSSLQAPSVPLPTPVKIPPVTVAPMRLPQKIMHTAIAPLPTLAPILHSLEPVPPLVTPAPPLTATAPP
ncbi:MAG: hypothetical protein ABL897_08580, partial [Hyphomicrobium sp.]